MDDDNIDVGGSGNIGDDDIDIDLEGGDVDVPGSGDISDLDPEYDLEDGEIAVEGPGYINEIDLILDDPKLKIPVITVHSISFGEAGRDKTIASTNHLNTWRDWHMVPTSRPSVNAPKARTNQVTVPGKDGILDYSEVMGGVRYENRTGTWEFAVYHEINEALGLKWTDIYSDLMTNIHGQELQVFLEDEPKYYYTGRVFVKNWKNDKWFSTVTLEYDLDPYKFTVERFGTKNNLYDAVTGEYNYKQYAVWFQFPVPVISKFAKKPVDRLGAYIKFPEDAVVEKAAFMVDTDDYPTVRIKAAAAGQYIAPAVFVPYVSYGDMIKADGYKKPQKLGTETMVARNGKYYYTANLFEGELKTSGRYNITEYSIEAGSNMFELFDNLDEMLEYMDED